MRNDIIGKQIAGQARNDGGRQPHPRPLSLVRRGGNAVRGHLCAKCPLTNPQSAPQAAACLTFYIANRSTAGCGIASVQVLARIPIPVHPCTGKLCRLYVVPFICKTYFQLIFLSGCLLVVKRLRIKARDDGWWEWIAGQARNDGGRQPHPRPLSLVRRGGYGEWWSGVVGIVMLHPDCIGTGSFQDRKGQNKHRLL